MAIINGTHFWAATEPDPAGGRRWEIRSGNPSIGLPMERLAPVKTKPEARLLVNWLDHIVTDPERVSRLAMVVAIMEDLTVNGPPDTIGSGPTAKREKSMT